MNSKPIEVQQSALRAIVAFMLTYTGAVEADDPNLEGSVFVAIEELEGNEVIIEIPDQQ
jgi:hypothetical protein